MATTPFEASVPNSSFLFDIYHDGQTGRNNSHLPGGACNFADLTPGANGARCGCRRFWSRSPQPVGFQDNLNPGPAVWCMCTHHACFHDDIRTGQDQATAVDNIAGQENQKPRANREPLSPVQDLPSFCMPPNLGSSLDLPELNFNSSFASKLDAGPAPQVEHPNPRLDSSLPDTLSWSNFIQSQPGNNTTTLPPIPQQCLMPSPGPPSTTTSSQTHYLRPFAGKGLHTLSNAVTAKSREAVTQSGTGSKPRDQTAQEATHAEIPDSLEDLTAPNTPSRHRLPGAGDKSASDTFTGPSREAFQQLSNTIQGHEERLDRLENVSFSVNGHEDCNDRHEQIDLRVTDLESRVEEVEKILSNDNSSVASSRLFHRRATADDAAVSVASVSTNPTARVEMYSQLQSLQAQVNQLRASSLPSYNSPWELEVVFLPFPLKGIWMEAHEFPSQRQPQTNWTQLPNTHSRATPDPQSPYVSEWISHGQDAAWLLPRACAPGRLVDQRLKSRGLIRTVSVKGSDARSVQLAVSTAFGNTLPPIPAAASSPTLMRHSSFGADARLATFLGLRQPWVPLRKLHKDSRLRFLTPAEMMTPTLWDVAFLASSVVMKATGMQRLYVTQPEAYLQDHPFGLKSLDNGWTWQKLREFSRVYPDSQGSSDGDVPEADALEDCWSWNDRLDEPPNSRQSSSLSLRQAAQRVSRRSSTMSPSQQYYTGVESPLLSTSPTALRAQSPQILRERKGSRPPHVRTTSMPPSLPPMVQASQSKRRVVSYANHIAGASSERRTSPFAARPSPRLPSARIAAAGAVLVKSRRGTRSPSLRPRNTPRWSASKSPSPDLPPGGPGAVDERGERRTTPFYYATPFSNLPFEPPPNTRASSRGLMPPHDYEGDDDEDMDDRGSLTDPDEDSQMTHDADGDAPEQYHGYSENTDEADVDIDVYEDEADDADELDHVDTGGGAGASQQHGHQTYGQGQGRPLPEDEPWPGIEDHMSDEENVAPHSDVSSEPSEYPSTQKAWGVPEAEGVARGDGVGQGGESGSDGDGEVEFKIHEDEGGMDLGGLTS